MRPDADLIRVGHMLDAVREVMGYVTGATRASLDTNPMLVRAVIKCLEVIGEAASRVTPETRAQLTDVPWSDIVAMRNRLIHTLLRHRSGHRVDDRRTRSAGAHWLAGTLVELRTLAVTVC
jgi:uncharacterized protein with HEPN domain